MKKALLLSGLIIVFTSRAFTQENNPLIASEPIIKEGLQLHDKGQYKEAIALYKKIPRNDTKQVHN